MDMSNTVLGIELGSARIKAVLIDNAQRSLYMSDKIHPTKAVYRDWWGLELERQLNDYLAQ